jgi:hypothetical protein
MKGAQINRNLCCGSKEDGSLLDVMRHASPGIEPLSVSCWCFGRFLDPCLRREIDRTLFILETKWLAFPVDDESAGAMLLAISNVFSL